MLTLFKDAPVATPSQDPIEWARREWRKALDKGHILTTLDLSLAWRRDFPESLEVDFESWVQSLGLEWLIHRVPDGTREIFCHAYHLIEAVGIGREKITSPLREEDWELWVETLAARVRLEFNYSSPCGSAHLDIEGSQWRATLLHNSIAPQGGAKVFLRKIASTVYPLENFSLESSGSDLLVELVRNRENILIAGSTGSGKTSLLSSLLNHIDPEDHVVLLEDTQEITCTTPRLTRMLAAKQNGRSLSDYLAHSLRLSPDRIIVGEMRSHEVIPYLLAMNTGHKGLMSTLHASSAMDAILRVAQLFVLASGQKDINYQEVLKLVARNVGYVVFVDKRKITQVIKVFGSEGDMPLYDVIL